MREPLRGVIWRVAAPAVASNLLMTVFLAVDAFWIGTRLGATALAAATASVFWVWMGISVAEMVSVGLTAVAARRHGEGRAAEAARTAGDAVVLALLLGGLAAAAGRLGLGAMFAAMHTPAPIAALGREYLGLYVLAAPVLYGYFAVDATFRAAGYTRTPFLILLASVAVALALDPVLILGLGPAPRLGIAGAALAPMVASTTLTVARIPLAAWAAARFGVVGLWWVIAATATLRGVAMVGLWRLGRWKRNVV